MLCMKASPFGASLDLLEKDISRGRHVGSLQNELALAELANIERPVDLEEDIDERRAIAVPIVGS